MAQYLDQPRALDGEGRILPGARLYAFEVGTETPQTIWADYERAVPHPLPLVADAAGRWPPFYIDPALEYRILIEDAEGNEVFDADPYTGLNLPGRTPLAPLDDEGSALPLARLTFWRKDTTQLAPIYQTASLQDQWPNPVTADGGGLFEPIYVDEAREYRVRLERADGTLVYDLDYQHVPEVFFTSRPYPVEAEDALAMAGSMRPTALIWTAPEDFMEMSAAILGGDLHEVLRIYDDALPEALELSGSVLSGVLDEVLLDYPNYQPEALELSAAVLSGALDEVLIDYPYYQPEAIEMDVSVLGGSLT